MAAQKAKLCVIALALLLAGCGQPLSQREIIRAAFFENTDHGATAVLLVEDTDLPEGETGYKTVTATADTYALAMDEAEQTLPGSAFYGLMDIAALPHLTTWAQAQEIGSLLYKKAQPAPEIDLFMLDDTVPTALEDKAGGLYDAMKAAEKQYHLQTGLERLAASDALCTLPVWQKEGYGYAILRKSGASAYYLQPLCAQLAAILSGQSSVLSCTFAQGSARCKGDAAVLFEPEPTDTGVCVTARLMLKDISLIDLQGTDRGEEMLQAELAGELQQAFRILANSQGDPLRFSFWAQNLFGENAGPLTAALVIKNE